MKLTFEEYTALCEKFKASTNEEKEKIIKDLNPPYPDDPIREAKRQRFVCGLTEPVKFEGSYYDD